MQGQGSLVTLVVIKKSGGKDLWNMYVLILE